MERLCDMRATHLVIACSPCERRGIYGLAGLRRRFGNHASVLDVYLQLIRTCRSRRESGSQQPDGEVLGCRAKLDTVGGAAKGGMPSRT